jgi:hypothetical protein
MAANRARHPGGRPTKLTPERQTMIVDAIRGGVPPETAAAYAGIDESTFYRWLRRGRGEDPEPLYATFAAEVQTALAEWEIRDVLLIGDAARGDWRAAAWRLERRLPKRYGRRERHELANADETAFRVAIGQQPRTILELHEAAAFEAAEQEESDDDSS